MNLKLILCLFLIAAFSHLSASNRAKSTNTPQGYHIKVTINGINGGSGFLAYHQADRQLLKDSANFDANGNIVFKGSEKLDGGIYLIGMPDKSYFELIIDKEQHFSVETDQQNIIEKMKITGSSENERFYDYLRFTSSKQREIVSLREKISNEEGNLDELRAQMAKLEKEVSNFRLSIIEKHPDYLLSKVFLAMREPDFPEPPIREDGTRDSLAAWYMYKNSYWDNIDLSDDRLLRTPIFFPRFRKYVHDLTIQHADSVNRVADELIERTKGNPTMFRYIVHYITNTYERSNLMSAEGVFVHMVDNYYATDKVNWVTEEQRTKIVDRANVLRPILLGRIAPDLMMADTTLRYHNLYSVKADYTVVYFWSTTCGHCKTVTPKLHDFYKRMKNKGLQVYAINVDGDVDEWKKYIRENNLSWVNTIDPDNSRRKYDIASTPVIYLLDEKKEIVAKRLTVDQLEEIVGKLVKK